MFIRVYQWEKSLYRFAQPIMKVCMTHSTSQPSFLQTNAWMKRLRSR